jgi:hypothetical protein
MIRRPATDVEEAGDRHSGRRQTWRSSEINIMLDMTKDMTKDKTKINVPRKLHGLLYNINTSSQNQRENNFYRSINTSTMGCSDFHNLIFLANFHFTSFNIYSCMNQ